MNKNWHCGTQDEPISICWRLWMNTCRYHCVALAGSCSAHYLMSDHDSIGLPLHGLLMWSVFCKKNHTHGHTQQDWLNVTIVEHYTQLYIHRTYLNWGHLCLLVQASPNTGLCTHAAEPLSMENKWVFNHFIYTNKWCLYFQSKKNCIKKMLAC